MQYEVIVRRTVSTKEEADALIAKSKKRGWDGKKRQIGSADLDFKAIRAAANSLTRREERETYEFLLHRIEDAYNHRRPSAKVDYGLVVCSDAQRRWLTTFKRGARGAYRHFKKQGLKVSKLVYKETKQPRGIPPYVEHEFTFTVEF